MDRRTYKRNWQRKWRREHPLEAAAASRKSFKSSMRRLGKKAYYRIKYQQLKAWRLKNPLKIRAHRKVFVALRNGTLIRKPCEVCGKLITDAHHRDYRKPLEVVWLCRRHHQEADRNKRKKGSLVFG